MLLAGGNPEMAKGDGDAPVQLDSTGITAARLATIGRFHRTVVRQIRPVAIRRETCRCEPIDNELRCGCC